MKMKKPQIRTSWSAVLAALGATAAMLPVHVQGAGTHGQHPSGMSMTGGQQARDSGGNLATQPPTSVYQQEMSTAPGRPYGPGAATSSQQGMQQGMDAQGAPMQDSQQGMDAQGSPQQQNSGGNLATQPPTSVYQPEMSTAPGRPYGPAEAVDPQQQRMQQQSRDTQGWGSQQQQGMQQQQGSSGSMGSPQQQNSGGNLATQPPTSVYQPEMSTAPGRPYGPAEAVDPQQQRMQQQSQDAQGSMMQGSQQGMGMQRQGGSGGMGSPQQQNSGGNLATQPMTSVYQQEMSTAPGRPYGPGEATTPRQGGQQQGLTREQVQAETEAWREAGLLELMDSEDSSVWMDPEVRQMRDQLNAQTEAMRGMEGGSGTRDAGGMGPGGSR